MVSLSSANVRACAMMPSNENGVRGFMCVLRPRSHYIVRRVLDDIVDGIFVDKWQRVEHNFERFKNVHELIEWECEGQFGRRSMRKCLQTQETHNKKYSTKHIHLPCMQNLQSEM